MAIWLRGLERWYLVLGGVAVDRGFEPQFDLELSFAEILLWILDEKMWHGSIRNKSYLNGVPCELTWRQKHSAA
jgi:hypothetical protein